MQQADLFRLLFDYTWWARDRILAAADGMTEDEYAKPNGFNYGSLRGILTHCFAAEAFAHARWQGVPGPAGLNQEGLPTIEALAQRWRESEEGLRPLLAALDDAGPEREIVTRRASGEETRRVLNRDMMQIVNHSTQHRSEAAEALTMAGRSPGDLDFSVFLRSRA
jgi:uncharacterized damage-inducible protein DinB